TRQNTDTFASGLKFFRSKQNTTAIATGGNSLSGFGRDYVKRPVNEGCVAFFNGTTAGGNWFQHTSTANTDTGNAYSLATTCYSIFQYPIPPQVSSNRPWALDGSGTPGNVSEWGIGPY